MQLFVCVHHCFSCGKWVLDVGAGGAHHDGRVPLLGKPSKRQRSQTSLQRSSGKSSKQTKGRSEEEQSKRGNVAKAGKGVKRPQKEAKQQIKDKKWNNTSRNRKPSGFWL